MSEPREALRRVVIAGDGPLGVLAACALKKSLPQTDVVVIALPHDPMAFAEAIGTGLPFANRLHDRIGLEEEQLVRRAGASHRLVMHYAGWGGVKHAGAAAYGGTVDPKLKTAFAREWGGGPRNASSGAPVGSVNEALARSGRFMCPDAASASALADVDYALRWNVPAYRDLLIARAASLGVKHVKARISGLTSDGLGGVEAFIMDDGTAIGADLCIDCSGPDAHLLSKMPSYKRLDWESFLPVRRMAVRQEREGRIALADKAQLTSAGWMQEFMGRDGRVALMGLTEGADEAAIVAALGGEPQGIVSLSKGRAALGWIGNVIALGDAAAQFEPLGWLNADLAHRQLDLLLEMLPGREINPHERAEYNRRAGMMADRVRDVIAAHYAAPAANSLFGEAVRTPELALTLDQFARRGRLPFFEEMPFLSHEWASLVHALGLPQGQGAVEEASGKEIAAAAMRELDAKCDAALRAFPPYGEWLQHQVRGQGAAPAI